MRRNTKCRIAVRSILTLVFVVASAFGTQAGDKKDVKRAEINAMATAALKAVLAESPEAKGLQKQSIGYAAFENLQAAAGVSDSDGSGVVVPYSGKRVYMKMRTAGTGSGLDAQQYQVVFFFETAQAMTSFMEKGWQGEADTGGSAATTFKNGVAIFQRTGNKLMASTDITGTKYWKTNELN